MIQKKSVLFSKILYMSFVLFMILENVLICPNVYKMCIIICNTIYSDNKNLLRKQIPMFHLIINLSRIIKILMLLI